MPHWHRILVIFMISQFCRKILSSRFTQFFRRILGTDSADWVAFRMYGSINAENYCEPEEDSQWGEKLVRCTEAVFDLQQNIQTLLILLVTVMMRIFMSMRICLRGWSSLIVNMCWEASAKNEMFVEGPEHKVELLRGGERRSRRGSCWSSRWRWRRGWAERDRAGGWPWEETFFEILWWS